MTENYNQCKICGGVLDLSADMSIGTCQYCGSVQPVSKGLDEKKLNLLKKADHFRIKKEFDKASGFYESILSNYPNDSDAYWGIVLCKYGIEYVEDPNTGVWVPTCHRTQYDSILNDEDYKAAIENADISNKQYYMAEAKKIDNIQKRILMISKKEKPFDVFICYKEKEDTTESRTSDSVRAQDLYDKLTGSGFRVFFSRITLEDKLGSDYEPYIFAALNSVKVMIVVGSRPDYLNSVWVKNEWSRFLSLAKKDPSRVLIPAYFNMDPYDMPTEFAHLQAQDMGKMGFEQDLIRAIRKTLDSSGKNPAPETSGNVTADSLLDRAFIFMCDRQFNDAVSYFDKVLDRNPRDHRAYWGKMLSGLQCVDNADMLGSYSINRIFYKHFSQLPILTITDKNIQEILHIALNPNYKNAVEFAPENTRQEYLSSFNELKAKIKEDIEQKQNIERDCIKQENIARKAREEEAELKRREQEEEAERQRQIKKQLELEIARKAKIRRNFKISGSIIIAVINIILFYLIFVGQFFIKANDHYNSSDSNIITGIISFYMPLLISATITAIVCVVCKLKNSGLKIITAMGVVYSIICLVYGSIGQSIGMIILAWTLGLIIWGIATALSLLPGLLIIIIASKIKE